jgi:hypothetical protein
MTTHKKDLAEHAEAMGFEVPATAMPTEEPVEGELMTEEETYGGGEYSSDIPEHSSEALPIHQRSLPKVALAVGAITVLFGLPAYLFLSAASGGGGATNTAKTDGKDKDKKAGLQDPQTDEINKLKTNLAVGKQLASASPSPSPATSPTADDKTTAKPSTPPAAPATVAPTVSPAPIVAKANPQAVAPPPVAAAAPASPKPSVAPLPVVQPKQLPSVVAKTNSPPVAALPSPSVVAPASSQPTAAPKVIAPAVIKQPANTPVAKPLAAPSTVLVTKTNPKPIEYTPKNPPVTSTPAVLVKSAPKVTPLPPVAKASPKAVEYTPQNPPVAPRTQPSVTLAATPKTQAAPISWEQASAIGVYGGDASSIMPAPVGGLGVAAGAKDVSKDSGKQQQSKYEGALSPNLLLAAGTNVKGHTLAPYAVGISAKNQSEAMPLSIALDESIELGKGYHLPVGTTVHFVASVRDNGSVVATSKNADIGGVEIPLPEGAISLASENNGLLIAKEISTGDGDLARADTNSSIWGGVAGAGKAILQSGGQTTTNTGLLGTTTTQTNNGSPNILGGILEGAFSPLATNGQRRAQQVADRIEQRSKLNEIAVGTKVKLFVNVPINVQIPVSGQQVGQTVPEDDGESQTPPQLVANNSAPASQEETPPPPLPQTAIAAQPAVTPAAVLPQAQPVVPVPVVRPLTPLPLNPPKTRISIP